LSVCNEKKARHRINEIAISIIPRIAQGNNLDNKLNSSLKAVIKKGERGVRNRRSERVTITPN
jgi:hypothetical protein